MKAFSYGTKPKFINIVLFICSDFNSMVISGVIKLRAGQNISIWLHSSLDMSYSISQDSLFSVVFLSPLTSIYGSAAQLMLSESISQNNKDASGWKKIQNWKTTRTNTAPGIFRNGKTTIKKETTAVDK